MYCSAKGLKVLLCMVQHILVMLWHTQSGAAAMQDCKKETLSMQSNLKNAHLQH